MDEQELPQPARDETPAERDDRNWTELLQEVRVTQTGIQILSGFLLTIPFQSRFTDLSPRMVGLFVTAVGFAATSTLLVVAPVSLHRVLFRRHLKRSLVDVSDILAKTGLAFLAVTITLVTGLVFGFVLGESAAMVAIVVAACAFVGVWIVLPLTVLARSAGPR
jgi:hypothetical protein